MSQQEFKCFLGLCKRVLLPALVASCLTNVATVTFRTSKFVNNIGFVLFGNFVLVLVNKFNLVFVIIVLICTLTLRQRESFFLNPRSSCPPFVLIHGISNYNLRKSILNNELKASKELQLVN